MYVLLTKFEQFLLQPAGYGYQQQVITSLRPGGTPMPNFFVPMVQRQGQQVQRPMGRRGNLQQQQPQQQQQQTQQVTSL